MHIKHIYTAALGAAVIAVGLTGCGGIGSGVVVAQVDGHSISEGTLDHWIPIEAILTYQLKPSRPVPKGVVPDPPNFKACAAYLKATPARIIERGQPRTAAQLKHHCQQHYRMLQQTMLRFLIHAQWVIGEAAAEGVKVSEREVIRRLANTTKAEFPGTGAFAKHLALTRETFADQLFRAKVKLLTEKLEQKRVYRQKTSRQQQQALARFVNELPKKWLAKTSCHAGYVVPECKQYRGPLPPEFRI